MPKSKHWVLLADYGDFMGHGKDYLTFKISEKMGLPYTPRSIPIEVVLNGDYIGMYFLTEHIRIDKDRVNITEQENGETDSLAVTGGWLLEIDNYNDPNQIKLVDYKKNNSIIRITYHSPDSLSQEQLNYLTNYMNSVNNAVNTDDKTSKEWKQYIDVDNLALYYVVQEAIDNMWAFSGSSWFYKDRGDSTKLCWGVIWDAAALDGRNDDLAQTDFFYNANTPYANNHWIGEIAKFPDFQIALRSWWKKYRDEVFPTIQDEVDAFEQLVSAALASDYLRWEDASSKNIHRQLENFMRRLTNRRIFLGLRWDDPEKGITLSEMMTDGFSGTEYIISDNLAVMGTAENGNRVFVTDGNNNWLQILAGDYCDQISSYCNIVSLRGVFTGKDFIPTLTLTAAPDTTEATLMVKLNSYDVNAGFNPAVNEVVTVRGVYDAASNSLKSVTEDGVMIVLDTSWNENWTAVDGTICTVDGVVQIKEPWPTSDILLSSFELPHQNYIIYPLEVDDGSISINRIEGDVGGDTFVNVVNLQSQLIKQCVKKSEATQGLLPGIYIIGNKKVVITQ